MDALLVAQSMYNSTIKHLTGKEVELDVETALAVATFCAMLAQAEQAERLANRAGNIAQHLAVIAANIDRIDHNLQRIADALYTHNVLGEPVESIADLAVSALGDIDANPQP